MGKNVRIRGTAFAANLERLRLQSNLSKTDLAQATGLSWRTIDNYSKDRFEFAQESALLRIAEVLEVSLEDLFAPCEKKRAIYGQPVFLFAVIMAFALVSGLALRSLRDVDHIEILENSVRLPGGELKFQSTIVAWAQNTWADRDVLVIGKLGNSEKYGSVLAIDVVSAEVLWEHRPDKETLKQVFPTDKVTQGDFYAHTLSLTDLDGDGVKEVAAAMRHNMFYPSYLTVIDNSGHVESTYYCAGAD
jgi:DNA-binding Xre family transcriptional regulator